MPSQETLDGLDLLFQMADSTFHLVDHCGDLNWIGLNLIAGPARGRYDWNTQVTQPFDPFADFAVKGVIAEIMPWFLPKHFPDQFRTG